uniref:GT23 domain-containing protein n=1 Tax=Guillardia theta TaxID=55529 RepID=A0A7S4JH47_GUITH|mmetsp:Transcript_16375/g.54825  ORF Transcript_16375/g.54825 Transcript_16375/m.54825 type:complete len:422 (+) Transcript_16375:111-1376(+)
MRQSQHCFVAWIAISVIIFPWLKDARYNFTDYNLKLTSLHDCLINYNLSVSIKQNVVKFPQSAIPLVGGSPILAMQLWRILPQTVKIRMQNISNKCHFRRWHDIFQKHRSRWSNGRNLIWACKSFCGGNGDRLRGLAHAMYLSLCMGYDLLLDWTHPVPISRFFVQRPSVSWLAKPGSQMRAADVHIMDSRKPLGLNWKQFDNIRLYSNMDALQMDCGTNETNLTSALYFEDSSAPITNGYHVYGGTYHMVGCTFWHLFSLNDELTNAVLGEVRSLNTLKQSRSIIACHIRIGDIAMGVGSDHRVKGTLADIGRRVMVCASYLARKLKFQQFVTVLVSDSNALKQLFQSQFPNMSYVSKYPPYHTDRGRSNSVSGSLGSWVDTMLLALSDAVILSPSGFGAVAAQIGLFLRDEIAYIDECN